jgi:hypothetical protein
MIYLLYSMIFIEVLSIGIALFTLINTKTAFLTSVNLIITTISAIFTLAQAIFLLIYSYRFAYNNQIYCDNKNILFTPGWTIGYYFIPILNIYKPYYAFKEFINNISSIDYEERRTTLQYLKYWWIFHFIGPFIAGILVAIMKSFSYSFMISNIASIVSFLLEVLFIMHSSNIQEHQIELVDSYSAQN